MLTCNGLHLLACVVNETTSEMNNYDHVEGLGSSVSSSFNLSATCSICYSRMSSLALPSLHHLLAALLHLLLLQRTRVLLQHAEHIVHQIRYLEEEGGISKLEKRGRLEQNVRKLVASSSMFKG